MHWLCCHDSKSVGGRETHNQISSFMSMNVFCRMYEKNMLKSVKNLP